MLVIKLKSLKPQPVKAPVTYLPPVKRQPTPELSEYERLYMQRDSIIRREFHMCNYSENDVVRPRDESQFKQYGFGKVKGILNSYRQWPRHVDFPEAPNVPQITLVEPIDGSAPYNCTSMFVRKATDQELNFLTENKVI